MKNLKVSLKLIVSFLIVIGLTVSVGAVGVYGMMNMSRAASDIYDYNLMGLEALGNLREIFNSQRSELNSILLYMSKGETEKIQPLFDNITSDDRQAGKEFATYEAAIENAADEAAYFEAKYQWENGYAAFKAEFEALVHAGNYDGAYSLLASRQTLFNAIIDGLNASAAFNNEDALAKNLQTDSLFATLLTVMIAIIAAAAAVALALAFYVSGLISKPLSMLTTFMKRASSTGDITIHPDEEKAITAYSLVKDEIGQCISAGADFFARVTKISDTLETIADNNLDVYVELLSENDKMGISMQKMVNNLNAMFGEINIAALQVATGSVQISEGAQSLAQGSTEQAATVEELSASIGEIAVKTKENADMAGASAQLAERIKHHAEKGSSQMSEMMAAVNGINQASENIGKVIKVIDDIAFQTNILALNAAVEAARAGQHGRGFAVVADEVRSLAAKSAEAAKETGEMISNSIEKARSGVRIAEETAASLAEIVSEIGESSEIVKEIARSSENQNVSISQVNEGIDQVAQVVQQNSATAEESAAASEELSGQSSLLEELINRFKLREEHMIHEAGQTFNRMAGRPSPAKPSTYFAVSSGGKY